MLLQIPDELVLAVLSWLPLASLLNCCYSSKALYRLARDSSLWKGLFVEVQAKIRTTPRLEANSQESMCATNSNAPPSPRLWCSSVIHKGSMYLYGGHTTEGISNLITNVKSDLFQYEFATKKWQEVTNHGMGGKTEHKCVPYKDALWFVGGYNGYEYTNHIFKYDPERNMSSVVGTSGEPFSPRSALTAVVWRDRLIVFGGWNGFLKVWYNDAHEYNFETKVWMKLNCHGTAPPQRTSHAAVVYKNCMYVFAGFSGETYLNDFHELNLETRTWKDITKQCSGRLPSPRSRFCAAVHGDTMYILGGWDKGSYFDDLHTYNFVTRGWTRIMNSNFEIPRISQYSLCVYQDYLCFFGGFCANTKEFINRLYLYHLPAEEEWRTQNISSE